MNVRNQKIKEWKKKSALPNNKQSKSKKLKNQNLFPKLVSNRRGGRSERFFCAQK
jgi:hypothetical protein